MLLVRALAVLAGLGAAVGSAAAPAQSAGAASHAAGTSGGRHGLRPAPAPSLCSADERTYFSCPISRRRLVSVCGSQASSGEHLLQYRVGPSREALELAWPDRAEAPQGRFEFVDSSGAQSVLLNLRFRIGATSYVVYRYSGRWDDGHAGVAARGRSGAWRYTPCESGVEQPDFIGLQDLGIDVERPDFDSLVFPP